MDTLIVFGPGPDRLATLLAVVRLGVPGTVLTGTTVDEVERYGTPLAANPTLRPCMLVFEHSVPGARGSSSEAACLAWKSRLGRDLAGELSSLQADGTGLPEMSMAFARSRSSVSVTYSWPSVQARRCIAFARALERIYAAAG